MYPVLFEIGSVPIRSWGVLVMLGFLAGLFIASREARRRGLDPNHILDFSVWGLIGALIGARLMYVLLDLSVYLQNPIEILYLQAGGLSLHGAVIGGTIVALIFARRRKIAFWGLADIVAPGLILGTAFGRVGCFLNGCCYGKLCDISYIATDFSTAGVFGLRHPTQLYEMGLNLAIFGLLWFVFRHRQKFEGQIFILYIVLYSVARFTVEIWRDSEILFSWLTVAQGASIVIALSGVVLWMALRARGMPEAATDKPKGPARRPKKSKAKAAKARS